jgi:uncharacterized CHY-type Zn-finger protein
MRIPTLYSRIRSWLKNHTRSSCVGCGERIKEQRYNLFTYPEHCHECRAPFHWGCGVLMQVELTNRVFCESCLYGDD